MKQSGVMPAPPARFASGSVNLGYESELRRPLRKEISHLLTISVSRSHVSV